MTPITSLLDTYAPRSSARSGTPKLFSERHERFIAAPPDVVMSAIERLEVREIRVLTPLMALRMLPNRLLGRPTEIDAGAPVLDVFRREGFVLLGRRRREIAIGAIGRFWRVAGNQPNRDVQSASDFAAFAEPGWAKAVMSFEATAHEGGTRLVTVTRVVFTSAGARTKFAPYWALIRLPSGLIRRSMLAAIERRAVAREAALELDPTTPSASA